MIRWFTSDLHIGHANISRFCDRPYPHGPEGVDEMNADIIRRWNEQVAPEDEVNLEGDLVMGKIDQTLPLLALLNGRKRLRAAGNHDRCWLGAGPKGKARGWAGRYINEGGLLDIAEESTMVLSDGTGVRLHHFPYTGDSGFEDRYKEQRPKDHGQWLIHGHVHDAWRQCGRQINVGMDAWGGRLVSEDEIVALIAAGPQDLDRLPWTA